MNDYQNKVLSYFQSCGWTTEKTSQDQDGSFVKISNGPESYFSYIFDDEKSAGYKVTMRKMSALQNDSQKTKTTIIFSPEFKGEMDNAEEFSTVLVDNKEMDYLLENQQKNRDYKHIQLQAHNHIAFKKYLENPNNKSAFVNATGTGKSYLIAKVAQHNYPKKIGIMSSSSFILDQQEKLIGDISNLSYMTYAKGGVDYDNKDFTEDLDVLIMDEFHRAGAENWGAGVQNIIDSNKDLELVGLSATHIRHLDNKRNMVDELFEGNIISSLPLTTAIAKQILPMPKYVSGIYDIGDTTDSYKERINSSAMSDDKKQESLDTLNGLALDWNKFSNASTILADNLETYNGKYIVFCESIDHMNVMKEKMSEWIKDAYQEKHGKALTSDIKISEMHSKKTPSQNNEALESFDKVGANDGLNLLFTVDMLNEGKHVKGISGAFLLRRTTSPILYYQQMGRAFAASDDYSPLIIDMVGNINTIHSNIFSEELAEKIAKEKEIQDSLEPGFELPQLDISGKIISYNDDVVRKLEDLDSLLSPSNISFDNKYELLKSYYDEHGNINIINETKYKGENIGYYSRSIKEDYRNNKLSEEQIKKLDDINFQYNPKNRFEKNYLVLKEFYDLKNNSENKLIKNKNITTSETYLRKCYKNKSLDDNQIKLLKDIDFRFDYLNAFEDHYKKLEKAYANSEKERTVLENKDIKKSETALRKMYKSLDDEQMKKLDNIGFKISVKKSAFEIHYPVLEKHYKDDASVQNKEYKKSLGTLRMYYRSGALNKDEIEKLKNINFDCPEILASRFDRAYPLLQSWLKENGDLNIKGRSIYQEQPLGQMVSDLRKSYVNNKLSKDEMKILDDMGFEHKAREKKGPFNIHYTILKESYAKNKSERSEDEEKVMIKSENALRKAYRENKLNDMQIKTLKEMGFKTQRKTSFDINYPIIKKYYEEFGNTNIKKRDEYNGQKIGNMVLAIRKNYKDGKLDKDQIQLLKNIKFDFGVSANIENINQLKDFQNTGNNDKSIDSKELFIHLKSGNKALIDKVRKNNSEPVM